LLLLSLSVNTENPTDGRRLIALSESHTEWLTVEQVFKLAISRVHFMDITDFQNVTQKKAESVCNTNQTCFRVDCESSHCPN